MKITKSTAISNIIHHYTIAYEKICSKLINPCQILVVDEKCNYKCNYKCNLLKTDVLKKLIQLATNENLSKNEYESCMYSEKYVNSVKKEFSSNSGWLDDKELAFFFVACIVEYSFVPSNNFNDLFYVLYDSAYGDNNTTNDDIRNSCIDFFHNKKPITRINNKFSDYLKDVYWGLYEYCNHDVEKTQTIISTIGYHLYYLRKGVTNYQP